MQNPVSIPSALRAFYKGLVKSDSLPTGDGSVEDSFIAGQVMLVNDLIGEVRGRSVSSLHKTAEMSKSLSQVEPIEFAASLAYLAEKGLITDEVCSALRLKSLQFKNHGTRNS
jgi:hypothetical protein